MSVSLFAFFPLSSFKSLLPPLTFVLSDDKTVALPPSVPCPVPPHHDVQTTVVFLKRDPPGHQSLCPHVFAHVGLFAQTGSKGSGMLLGPRACQAYLQNETNQRFWQGKSLGP